MTKRKDANPFNEGTPISDILGVDPNRVRKKIRGREAESGKSLLTSTDLFGEIIDEASRLRSRQFIRTWPVERTGIAVRTAQVAPLADVPDNNRFGVADELKEAGR